MSFSQPAIQESLAQSVMEQIEKSKGIARRGLMLKLMTALKQVHDEANMWVGDDEAASNPHPHKKSRKSCHFGRRKTAK